MSTARLLQPQRHRIGAGFQADGLREPLALLDPFIMVDHFRMREAVFAPHPHAGFSAVTYLFDDSATGLISRDSLGGEHAIPPGGLHWTLAGRGVMHDEFPAAPGLEAHGLQIFVNLPADQKLRAPSVMRLSPEQMPRRRPSSSSTSTPMLPLTWSCPKASRASPSSSRAAAAATNCR
jgi:redox-sensitive bicupin YhaK (pirin superfamily)